MHARQRIATMFDSFEPLDHQTAHQDPIGFPDYRADRDAAMAATGESEAVIIGTGVIGDLRIVAAVFEFGFMGGTMSRAVGDRIEAAMEEAEQRRIPFLAVTSSGGARMQEGMAALSQMPRTVAASRRLEKSGIPRIAILCHPTTGGVYASFASLSDVIAAEAGATIGFAGPRVAEAMTGQALPAGSHTAEEAMRFGLIDAILTPGEMKDWLALLVGTLTISKATLAGPVPEYAPKGAAASAWDLYTSIRRPGRATPRDLIERASETLVALQGDRQGSDDPAVGIGLAKAAGRPFCFAVMGPGNPTASGFRKAQRAIALAAGLGLPLVTIVDTPGADPRHDSEYSGLAAEIARTFAAMIGCPTRTICLVSGEGGSGGALALAAADVLLMDEESVFSVIAPEGAAAILYRDQERSPEVAEALRPKPTDLMALGIIDGVVRSENGQWLQQVLDDAGPTSRRTERFRSTLEILPD